MQWHTPGAYCLISSENYTYETSVLKSQQIDNMPHPVVTVLILIPCPVWIVNFLSVISFTISCLFLPLLRHVAHGLLSTSDSLHNIRSKFAQYTLYSGISLWVTAVAMTFRSFYCGPFWMDNLTRVIAFQPIRLAYILHVCNHLAIKIRNSIGWIFS